MDITPSIMDDTLSKFNNEGAQLMHGNMKNLITASS